MLKYTDNQNQVHITYTDHEVLKYTYDSNADIKDLMTEEEKEELKALEAGDNDSVDEE